MFIAALVTEVKMPVKTYVDKYTLGNIYIYITLVIHVSRFFIKILFIQIVLYESICTIYFLVLLSSSFTNLEVNQMQVVKNLMPILLHSRNQFGVLQL